MSSIATKSGDGGQTGLAGGIRVSKASLRVDTYGNVDELNSALGFARSICDDEDLCASTLRIQRELFKVGSSLATPPTSAKPAVVIEASLTEALTSEVHALEAMEGMLSDWSVPGATPAGAAYDMARTICRRAERLVVVLVREGVLSADVSVYLNRLSDYLFVAARFAAMRAGAPEQVYSKRSGGITERGLGGAAPS